MQRCLASSRTFDMYACIFVFLILRSSLENLRQRRLRGHLPAPPSSSLPTQLGLIGYAVEIFHPCVPQNAGARRRTKTFCVGPPKMRVREDFLLWEMWSAIGPAQPRLGTPAPIFSTTSSGFRSVPFEMDASFLMGSSKRTNVGCLFLG